MNSIQSNNPLPVVAQELHKPLSEEFPVLPEWEEATREEDYMTDEETDKFLAAALLEPDETEKTTLSVFSALFSISEGTKRTQVAGGANDNIDDEIDDEMDQVFPALSKENAYTHPSEKPTRIRTFQKDIVFFDAESPNEEPTDFKNVIINIITIFGKIFIGGDYFFTGPNQFTLTEMNDLIAKEWDIWKNELSKHYKKHYRIRMSKIFNNAEGLVEKKSANRTKAIYERILLLGMICITVGAKLAGRKYITIFGGIASALTAIVMVSNYANRTIEESKKSAKLKQKAEVVYKDAGKFRKGG